MVRQGAETASAYYQQGRQQVQAAEHTLAEAIRAKPLQSIVMAAGLGMLVTLLWKKEETVSDAYRWGRQQVGAVQHTLADTMRSQPWQASYRRGRQQAEAVEYTLEDAIRAKPLQSMCIAAGLGLFLGVLVKK
jgi:ElaB/YqjD/DUF883 family membrane-anchored ribosome-binding protein